MEYVIPTYKHLMRWVKKTIRLFLVVSNDWSNWTKYRKCLLNTWKTCSKWPCSECGIETTSSASSPVLWWACDHSSLSSLSSSDEPLQSAVDNPLSRPEETCSVRGKHCGKPFPTERCCMPPSFSLPWFHTAVKAEQQMKGTSLHQPRMKEQGRSDAGYCSPRALLHCTSCLSCVIDTITGMIFFLLLRKAGFSLPFLFQTALHSSLERA